MTRAPVAGLSGAGGAAVAPPGRSRAGRSGAVLSDMGSDLSGLSSEVQCSPARPGNKLETRSGRHYSPSAAPAAPSLLALLAGPPAPGSNLRRSHTPCARPRLWEPHGT